MGAAGLSIRVDLASGFRIGPGKVALLEAIHATGSISAAARSLGMSYRRAWLLIEDLNNGLLEPVVTTESGGRHGGGASLTLVGERVIALYREIESQASSSVSKQFHALGILARRECAPA
jgi:molybdate transport system regulatory protein